jgi:hypothetical protein
LRDECVVDTTSIFDLLLPAQYSQVMGSHAINPDLKWYEEVTKRKGLKEPRCPFASVEKCPRYYQSLSLLGVAGVATAIDKATDQKLKKKWEHHHLWPKTREQETSIGGPEERPHSYCHLCPEVSHEAFGLFAEFLARYADELDGEYASERLGEIGAPSDDWRWSWQQVSPMHYADCPLYSPLLHDASASAKKEWWERPAGIVTLGVLITVIGGLILLVIPVRHDNVPSSVPAEQSGPQPIQPETRPKENIAPESTHPQRDPKGKAEIKQHREGSGAVGGNVDPQPCGIAQVGGQNNQASVNCFQPMVGNLKERTLTLCSNIRMWLRFRALPGVDAPPGADDKTKSEFARAESANFRLSFMGEIRRLRDEYAQMHIKKSNLDQYLEREDRDDAVDKQLRQVGRQPLDRIPLRRYDFKQIVDVLASMADELPANQLSPGATINATTNGPNSAAVGINNGNVTVNPPANPNASTVTYNCIGTKFSTEHSATGGVIERFYEKKEFETLKKMVELNNAKQYKEMWDVCHEKMVSAPEWLTPYLFCSVGYLAAGDKVHAATLFSYYETNKGPAYDDPNCNVFETFVRGELK